MCTPQYLHHSNWFVVPPPSSGKVMWLASYFWCYFVENTAIRDISRTSLLKQANNKCQYFYSTSPNLIKAFWQLILLPINTCIFHCQQLECWFNTVWITLTTTHLHLGKMRHLGNKSPCWCNTSALPWQGWNSQPQFRLWSKGPTARLARPPCRFICHFKNPQNLGESPTILIPLSALVYYIKAHMWCPYHQSKVLIAMNIAGYGIIGAWMLDRIS